MKNLYCLFLLIIFPPSGIIAQQNPVDSLVSELENTISDTSKVNLLNELANLSKGRDNDQALKYALEAVEIAKGSNFERGLADVYKTMGIIYFFQGEFDKAIETTVSSKETYESIDDKKGEAACFVNLGIFNRNIGEIKESGESFQQALNIYKQTDDKIGIAKTYLNLGNLFKIQGDFKNALDNYLQSLNFFEEVNDKLMVAQLFQNIGIVYSDQGDSDKALENYNKALEIFVASDDLRGMADVNNNIGQNYADIKEYELAIDYLLKSLKLFEQMGHIPMVAHTYYNLGDANNKIKNFDQAKEYFDKSLSLYENMNFLPGTALCYNGLGEYYFYQAKYRKAIEYLEKAKKISGEIRVSIDAVQWLSKAYEKIGKYKKAYENQVLFKTLNDSVFNENNEKAITALSMQYEFDKKEKIREIEEQKKEAIQKEKEERKEAIQKEKDKWNLIVKSGLSLLVVLMLVIAIISIVNFRRKVKANNLLKAQKEEIEHQKVELEQRNEEIQAQRDEIEDKNILITEQRDIALKQKEEITDSIQYAQRIQEAVLPDRTLFTEEIEDYFIYFRPKDIVSGDFYWMTKVDDKVIVTAADCTGHGVPGAFMSMLGVTFLNEIVNKDKVLAAGEILNRLRSKVIDSLHQKDRETKDGMDMAISIIDTTKKEIQYAGAYNPLYIIPAVEDENYEIQKIAADRMPIGIHLKNDKDFTNHVINYKKGDSIYMFSDGYADQFGGEKGRKLKSRKFQELLLKIQNKSMTEQKNTLDDFLINWKGDLDQLDDIIIIGIKL